MSFADAFRAELARRGISQTEAAELLGIKQQEASDWARGKRRPSNARVPKVARFLGISARELHALIDAEIDLSRRLDELEAEVAGMRADLKRLLRARR